VFNAIPVVLVPTLVGGGGPEQKIIESGKIKIGAYY
jgi:hypothetical protein